MVQHLSCDAMGCSSLVGIMFQKTVNCVRQQYSKYCVCVKHLRIPRLSGTIQIQTLSSNKMCHVLPWQFQLYVKPFSKEFQLTRSIGPSSSIKASLDSLQSTIPALPGETIPFGSNAILIFLKTFWMVGP